MPLDIPRTATVAVMGDSITQSSSPGYMGHLLPTLLATAGLSATANVSMSQVSAAARNTPKFLNFGVAGDKISDLIAREAAVIAAAPEVIIIECGVNDFFFSVGASTVQTNANTLMADFKAALPAVRLGWISILSSGDESAVSAQNAGIVTYNASIQSACATKGAFYIDVYTPRIAWELVNNPTNQANGYLTTDGTHPTDYSGAHGDGQRIYAGWVAGNLAVS